jgi:hypothetical protein
MPYCTVQHSAAGNKAPCRESSNCERRTMYTYSAQNLVRAGCNEIHLRFLTRVHARSVSTLRSLAECSPHGQSHFRTPATHRAVTLYRWWGLQALKIYTVFFSVITPCILVGGYQRFGECATAVFTVENSQYMRIS